ncbi:MAG: nucleoside-triphosphatase [Fimbriimonas sp.]
MSRITIISGASGSGKTRLCEAAVAACRARGVDVAGVVSRSEYEGEEKVRLYCQCVRGGERWLAERTDRPVPFQGPTTKCWAFDAATIGWANECLDAATPAQVLVIDEIGPLEFGRGEGFLSALTLLDAGDFGHALVVVRPGLTEAALKRWPHAEVVDLDAGATIDLETL